MIRKTSPFIFGILLCLFSANAQHHLLYESFSLGGNDTSKTEVIQCGQQIKIQSADKPALSPIPGTAKHYTYVDYGCDSVISQLFYSDAEQYYCSRKLESREYKEEGNETVQGYKCKKYSIILFSNKIELWFTDDLPFQASASTGFASLPGVMVKYCRNGNAITQLASVKKDKSIKSVFPENFGESVSSSELNQIEKDKLIITYPIFTNEQICFNPEIKKPANIAYDSVLHFANGTIILKKVKMDLLPKHYQIFAEVNEYSNGDAYDRTGSIFIIPMENEVPLLPALQNDIDRLPYFTDKSGEKFQGMLATNNYEPLIELMRFYTPFGVGHYNEFRSLPDQDWAEEVFYKQDITDFRTRLDGDVYIGAFIGNYDKGGHKLSLTIKAYPEGEEWIFDESSMDFVKPLFNTCNVMEMAGQNYGKFFRTDSLTVHFHVEEGTRGLRLRYTATGHGGWDNGDEFVPKANTIIIDGKKHFVHTPWRCDCGTYRTSNPASGNFWNGMSSSDYSRSGWCPGTATQPVFFDLSDLAPGEHTITVAIPQGEPEGGSFSYWNVSGVLIGTIDR